MSLVIVSLASLLAGLLVVQGLRAIATPNWSSSSQQQLEAQSRAFSELASQATLFDPEDADSLGTAYGNRLWYSGRAPRESLWRLVDGASGWSVQLL